MFFDEETLSAHLDLDDKPALAQADDVRTLSDLFSILKGGCHKNSLLIFTGQCGPALEDIQQRNPVKLRYLPGTLRGQTRLRRCWVVEPDFELVMASEAEVVNTPKPQQRYNAADTVVLRVSAALRFLEADQWKKIRGAPAASLREWIARADSKLLLAVRDTWGWQALDESRVPGLIRVSPSVARALLARGGELLGGTVWFFTPLDWAKLHLSVPVNLYQKPEEGEIDFDYLKRMTSSLGVHLGFRNLAIRVEASDPRNTPRVASWTLRNVPREWRVEELEVLLKSAGFEEVAFETKSPCKMGSIWGFKALRTDMRDFIPIAVAASEDSFAFTIEATRFKRPVPQRLTSNITTGVKHCFRAWNFQDALSVAKVKRGPKRRRQTGLRSPSPPLRRTKSWRGRFCASSHRQT